MASGSNLTAWGLIFLCWVVLGQTNQTSGRSSRVVYTPHLVTDLPPPPEKYFPGERVAVITSLYDIDTDDWMAAQGGLNAKLAEALGVSVNHLDVVFIDQLIKGETCDPYKLQCGRLTPGPQNKEADPTLCRSNLNRGEFGQTYIDDDTLWSPEWADDDEFQYLYWRTPVCASASNSSLLVYPYVLNNTYVTGVRDGLNQELATTSKKYLTLWVVGQISVKYAKFLNAKLNMNGTIPLPEFVPGTVDENATLTNDLNLSITIFGIRQFYKGNYDQVTSIRVCDVQTLPVKACIRVEHAFFEDDTVGEYALKYKILWSRGFHADRASDFHQFNISRGPWPTFRWIKGSAFEVGPWQQANFPQKQMIYHKDPPCTAGRPCDPVSLAPSARYLHSAVTYKTWNFWQHAWVALCDAKSSCLTDCLYNLTCLGGEDYFRNNSVFRSVAYAGDDGDGEPERGLDHSECPTNCCGKRRLCYRRFDVLGYYVPFDQTMMIVFGGRTYVHEKNDGGRLIYHKCERIPKDDLKMEWRSCKELATNDLWRYNPRIKKWEYLKPSNATSLGTGVRVGVPTARYGHAAAIIEIPEGNDGFKRVFMYMYGGIGNECEGGLCSDVWRYEVPWAAQSLFPWFGDGEWVRGNEWNRFKDCPFGGRFRHEMVATSDNEYIYVFGGQAVGGYDSELLRYRILTDLWEDLKPQGRVSLTRLMYDFDGVPRIMQVPTDLFDASFDTDCALALPGRYEGGFSHCGVCPHCRLAVGSVEEGGYLPYERSDFSMVRVPYIEDPTEDALVIFGGARTTWGVYYDEGMKYNETGDTPDESILPYMERFGIKRFFDDLWTYDPTYNQWVQRPNQGKESPSPRRGHRMVVLRKGDNGSDPLLLLVGGHMQDEQFGDMWTLDLHRKGGDGEWTRIDPYIFGRTPPSVSHHTMLSLEDMNMVLMFGGVSWNKTDLVVTDAQRNVDRRCFKEAQGLQENFGYFAIEDPSGETFLQKMRELCGEKNFCCAFFDNRNHSTVEPVPARVVLDGYGYLVRDMEDARKGQWVLENISKLCRHDCRSKQFIPDFYPIMSEGVWTFEPDVCPENCNNNGACVMSQCVCHKSFYGPDCGFVRCPGSTCYTHPKTRAQFCADCSLHGDCIEGLCVCDPAWSGKDCSMRHCLNNCSSTLTEERGICVADFPVNQCHCLGPFSGVDCSETLCLNGCGGHGSCNNGTCLCDKHWFGEDCSLFVWPLTNWSRFWTSANDSTNSSDELGGPAGSMARLGQRPGFWLLLSMLALAH